MLDEVVSIERVRADSDARYRKVYDVTVPGTLNFELFDGLCVRDTAETGYIQRRMVKAMEDLVVEEDGTVRNVMGNIVQMHYGGDGFDVTKVEKVRIPEWFLRRQWGQNGVPAAASGAFDALHRRVVPVLPTDATVCVPLALDRWLRQIVQRQHGRGGPGAGRSPARRTWCGGAASWSTAS